MLCKESLKIHGEKRKWDIIENVEVKIYCWKNVVLEPTEGWNYF